MSEEQKPAAVVPVAYVVQLVDVQIKAPKELNDVRVALVGLIEDLKAKKSLEQIAAGNLFKLSEAVGGIDKIPAEFQEELAKSMAVTGLLGGQVAGALLAPSPTVA